MARLVRLGFAGLRLRAGSLTSRRGGGRKGCFCETKPIFLDDVICGSRTVSTVNVGAAGKNRLASFGRIGFDSASKGASMKRRRKGFVTPRLWLGLSRSTIHASVGTRHGDAPREASGPVPDVSLSGAGVYFFTRYFCRSNRNFWRVAGRIVFGCVMIADARAWRHEQSASGSTAATAERMTSWAV
jgi:hypothetical protein